MSSLYAIADLHLSSTDSYKPEVYKGFSHWKDKIEANWRRIVREGDTVVLAGDVSFAKTLGEAADDFAFLESLPGKKIIVRGNHDSWWGTLSKMTAYAAENGFRSIGFLKNSMFPFGEYAICGTKGEDITSDDEHDKKILRRERERLFMSLKTAEECALQPIVFTHFPPALTYTADDEAISIMKNFGVKRCFYGHLHGEHTKSGFIGQKSGIEMRLISADFVQFSPIFIV
ncbi:MAG: metallophosphoesterase [Ruminococcus sp.]|jgi:predicted phosphohydrolase|nr:metallophosphoesterase [Ruminococcus sp.]